MKEIKRISSLFEDLYDGHPWLDVTIVATLQNVTASAAAHPVIKGTNSIWQLVNHIVEWRKNVLRRLQGETTTTPESNYLEPIADISDLAWANMLEALQHSQEEWIRLLENFSEKDFESVYAPNGHTYYEHIQGIIQHDAYHLGQIVLLKKMHSLLQINQ